MSIIRSIAFAAFIAVLPAAAPAAVIDFNNLDTSGPYGGNGKAFTSYTQNGYKAAVTGGSYIQYIGNGNPTPSIATGYFNATTNAALTLTGPGLFSFGSFDAYSDENPSSFTLSGYLGNSLVYSASGNVGVSTSAMFSTFKGFSAAAVDRVVLASTAPYRLTLDNINLSPAASAVPEPASWAMMVVGFGALGAAMRRRKPAAVRFA